MPSNPTNLQLVALFRQCLADKWGYVYGAQGETYTSALAEKWRAAKRSVPSGRNANTYFTVDCKKWFDYRVADCSGGIVWAIRQYNPSFTDRGANTFKAQFTKSGTIATIPEIPGLAVWCSGHIGVYIGNGKVIEFQGTNAGCVETVLAKRTFTHWGMIDGVTYDGAVLPVATAKTAPPTLRKGDKGDAVKQMQQLLFAKGYLLQGDFGTETDTAIRAFQKANGLVVDGICGSKTWAALEV